MINIFKTVGPLLIVMLAFPLGGDAEENNGFDLTDALVPEDKIHAGGPPRDGIPAIDQPHFLVAPDAHSMEPDDPVLGMVLQGVTKAYPLDIMNWHEIVNDLFDKKSVVVTYCPLCGTGMAFYANINGQDLKFGVSGLLYNSDVLFYDRATESLWSQLDRRAISGPYKGGRLEPVPLERTTWKDWVRRHPDTLVLSRKTGYIRDYDHSPYADYEHSGALYFPVDFRAQGYHPKERVLGVEIDGHFKAYPFRELSKLSKKGGILSDQIAGRKIVLHFDAENQNARIEDERGRALPSVVAFWFAWYAFHPETQRYQADAR
jgi:hypothetical protein